MENMNYPRYMTPKQVSEYLQIPISTFYKLSARGDLPGAVKVGGSIRVSLRILEEYLSKSRNKKLDKGGKE